jgi:hypothetical protein
MYLLGMSKKKTASKKPKVSEFYTTGTRIARGQDVSPLHILITPKERAKLIKLTHKMKLNAAGTVRALIEAATL